MTAQPFDVPRFQRLLSAARLGRPLEFHETIGSSNDRALELARSGAAHGTLVLADEQRSARGRHGRSWACAPRLGIWASLVLRPERPERDHAQLPLVVGLALCEALARDFGVREVELRWPNDIDVCCRKAAGILCERVSGQGAVVAGFGINVLAGAAPRELSASATSLEEEGFRCPREELLAACLARLEPRVADWEAGGFPSLRADYLGRMALVGERVHLRMAGGDAVGDVEGVDEGGALVLRTADGPRAFHAGAVERVR